VVGGQWTSDFFRNHDIPSPRAFLDAVSTEHIIYLDDDAGHNAWVNSAALALAGINRDTPDPEGGTFVRDADGEPNGLLYESARTPIWSLKPALTTAQYRSALAEALRQANRYGLTGVNEARAMPDVLEAYRQLDEAGELTAHLVANHQTPREVRNYPLDIDGIVAARDKYQSTHLHTDFVKIFLDGVPTASRTALMLDDYIVDEDHPQPTRGMLMVDPDTLKRDLIVLDKLGFTVKIHTAGDGSVRVALDALQAVREANGPSGLRHELAHAGFIDAQDLPRFAELGVTADLSPYIWYPSPIIDSVVGAIGPRGLDYFPVRGLLDSGANVLMGSDWPSAAKNLSPWHAIEALVTRRNPFEDNDETLWAEQAISLEQALAIATTGGAKAMRLEQLTGSVEVGKSADFIILDRNLFEVPIRTISDTQVEQTWFEGLPVYTKGE
jgi:predicted amidohydrolase YtcJ